MALVTVTLYGILNHFLPDRQKTRQVEFQGPSTAGDLLDGLGLPVGMLSLLLVNGKQVTPEALLIDGDLVEAFPVCGGGSDVRSHDPHPNPLPKGEGATLQLNLLAGGGENKLSWRV